MSHINFRGEANVREGLGITPKLGKAVMIDPTAVVMGDVCLGDDVSVWPHAAMRGDVQIIRIGARTNIQDGTVLHVTHDGPYNPAGFPLHIGEDVTVGHRALLHGCTVGNRVLVGMGAIIMDAVVVEDDVMIAAGARHSGETASQWLSLRWQPCPGSARADRRRDSLFALQCCRLYLAQTAIPRQQRLARRLRVLP